MWRIGLKEKFSSSYIPSPFPLLFLTPSIWLTFDLFILSPFDAWDRFSRSFPHILFPNVPYVRFPINYVQTFLTNVCPILHNLVPIKARFCDTIKSVLTRYLKCSHLFFGSSNPLFGTHYHIWWPAVGFGLTHAQETGAPSDKCFTPSASDKWYVWRTHHDATTVKSDTWFPQD